MTVMRFEQDVHSLQHDLCVASGAWAQSAARRLAAANSNCASDDCCELAAGLADKARYGGGRSSSREAGVKALVQPLGAAADAAAGLPVSGGSSSDSHSSC